MKAAVIYASTTGNPETMARAINDVLKETGNEVVYGTATEADKALVTGCDVLLLGSPAMGAETLEDSMEDFYSAIEGSIKGKKVGLFGSYDWGDGQWLRDWEDRVKNAGATSAAEPLMVHLTPEDSDIEKCKEWAKSTVK